MDHIIEIRREGEGERFEYTLHTEISDFRCESGCGALGGPRWQDREEGPDGVGCPRGQRPGGWAHVLAAGPRLRTPAMQVGICKTATAVCCAHHWVGMRVK